MKVGLLCSRIRVEEKLLFAALERRGLAYEVIDEARLRFDLSDRQRNGFSVVLERCADPWRAAYALRLLENIGLRCINPYAVAEVCGNQLLTTAALARAGVPHPRTMVAFSAEEGLAAAEAIGYPVVFKPALGAWGKLLGKVNDRQAAEAVIEHKEVLGTYHHAIVFVQEYIDKPGRDIRAYVVGDRVAAAVYRQADHWSTAGSSEVALHACPVTPELERLALAAARAVGGGVLSVDLIEERARGLLVVDIGHIGGFRRAGKAAGVDIAAAIVDYVAAAAEVADGLPARPAAAGVQE
jgi:[lysine-biosynthesis-protein LysW]--L-2-aminoadipate ligase